MIELMVLISETASAPPRCAACGRLADVGDVGRELDDHRHAGVGLAPARDHLDIFGHLADGRAHAALGHAVRAAEIELDAVGAGVLDARQDRLPARLRRRAPSARPRSARSGQSRLTCLISRRLTSSGRSVISSILLKPITRRSWAVDRAVARAVDVDDRRVLAERLPDHAAPAGLEGAHDIVGLVGRRRGGEPERVGRLDAAEVRCADRPWLSAPQAARALAVARQSGGRSTAAACLPSSTAATVRSLPPATQSPPAQTPGSEVRRSASTVIRPSVQLDQLARRRRGRPAGRPGRSP